MTPKTKAAWAAGVTFICTALVTVFREFEPGFAKGIWFLTLFLSWNYFAYAFDKQMLPWVFVEISGGKEGIPAARKFVYWATLFIHVAFLATMAFAD